MPDARLTPAMVRRAYEETGLRPDPYTPLSRRARRANALGALVAQRLGVARLAREIYLEWNDAIEEWLAAALDLDVSYVRGVYGGFANPRLPPGPYADARSRLGRADGAAARAALRDLERTTEPRRRRVSWCGGPERTTERRPEA